MAKDKSKATQEDKPAEQATADPPAPLAPPEVVKLADAPKEDKGKDATNEKEQAERAAALEKAQAANNKAANKIASDWARQDKALKTWMVDMGERIHGLLTAECAADKPYKVAMSDLVIRLRSATGEDKGADLTRCIRLYFAAVIFGREAFAKLPIRGQKEMGTLLTDVTDDKTGATVYVLAPDTAETAKKVFAYCCGDDGKTAVEGIDKSKEGIVIGEHIAKLVGAVKSGRNPLAPAAAKGEGKEGDKPATDGQQPPAGGTKNGKEGKSEDATGERPAAAGPMKLDVKPAVAGGEMVRLLAEHDAPQNVLHSAGKAKEMKAEMVEAIISGMADAGRIDDLRRIIAFAGREIRIALIMEKEKLTRKEAMDKMDTLDVRRAG